MSRMQDRLALHTWTLDTTPLPEALRAACAAGWNAVELRRVDFTRCLERGMSNGQVLDLVKSSGLKVACVGTEYGLIFASGAERERLLGVLDETCANAVKLGCDLVMIAPGQNPPTTIKEAAANFRAGGEVAKRHGVRFTLEFNSAHDLIKDLAAGREVVRLADHPNCGLLFDAYHFERSGGTAADFRTFRPGEIFAFQYSDVPAGPSPAVKRPTDRLPPGKGRIDWEAVFAFLRDTGYDGYLSYEGPNPEYWARPAEDAAREAVEATRRLLAQVE